MYSANRFPVMLYEGGPVGYAEGGLHDEALAVRKAGRNGDSRLVHVNDDEFAEMVAEYGEPTINPETGMPEFFLGKLGKILKAVAPIAVSFIPGVGPIAGAALGAGMGALSGGGLKGALIGGATGAIGGSGAAGKIGGTILGKGSSALAQKTLGDALIGGALGAATGQNPLQAALMSGGTTFLRGQLGPKPTTTTAPPATASDTITVTANPYMGRTPTFGTDMATQAAIDTAAAGGKLFSTAAMPTDNSITNYAAQLSKGPSLAASSYAPTAQQQTAKPNWWNRDVGFLGKLGTDLGLKNKHAAIVGGLLAAGAADALKPKTKTGEMTQEQFFGPSFNAKSPGSFQLSSIATGERPESAAADYARRYFTGYAGGGDVGGNGRSDRSSFAVNGPGTGRSDEIPAMLSDGEYVFDAETVALLGDGSSKAGAKKLDDLRVKVRKHKGKKLAKGKFSQNAKPADRYMAGGRI